MKRLLGVLALVLLLAACGQAKMAEMPPEEAKTEAPAETPEEVDEY